MDFDVLARTATALPSTCILQRGFAALTSHQLCSQPPAPRPPLHPHLPQVNEELDRERQAAEEAERQRRDAIEQQKAELRRLEEQRAQVGRVAGCWS